ncbi:zinc-ribbon domain-containing protein [Maribacter sp. MAR_2009_72]|uniref:zinc-ribbon domain-containing protein n=1 Tax=Maribacter sp. MAR_2009_72 TaxID=1250050 RepID=UPI00119AF89C|nr:zinc-ribbon domain-containing protein [Maribacter sp. MAR_2009_72]TVZ15293.1 zinc ribbon family protein [Maribacter sp. MAR_2009_72]
MILFFGTRPGKPETIKLLNTYCPYCEQRGTLTVVTHTNYFHLFWIKLFKISSTVMAECSHCKRGFYENEFTNTMLEDLQLLKQRS